MKGGRKTKNKRTSKITCNNFLLFLDWILSIFTFSILKFRLFHISPTFISPALDWKLKTRVWNINRLVCSPSLQNPLKSSQLKQISRDKLKLDKKKLLCFHHWTGKVYVFLSLQCFRSLMLNENIVTKLISSRLTDSPNEEM